MYREVMEGELLLFGPGAAMNQRVSGPRTDLVSFTSALPSVAEWLPAEMKERFEFSFQ